MFIHFTAIQHISMICVRSDPLYVIVSMIISQLTFSVNITEEAWYMIF
jgi:hypothetical protein